MNVRLWAAGLIAMVGGFLMVWSGYISHGILYLALGYAGSLAPGYLGGVGFAASLTSLAIAVLEYIVALGGVTVIIGGTFLVSGHARTGRILILLGGGAGFLGLLGSFGYTIYKLGASQTITYAPYWVGLLFAAVGRSLAKGARAQAKQGGP